MDDLAMQKQNTKVKDLWATLLMINFFFSSDSIFIGPSYVTIKKILYT